MSGGITSATVRSGSALENELTTARELLAADPQKALDFIETRLPAYPDRRLFRLAAEACRRLNLTADAEDAELAAIQASFKLPALDQAAVAAYGGNNAEAQRLVEKVLRDEPDDLLALTMAAESNIGAWQLEQAERRLRTVLARAPSYLRAIMLLAKCLTLQARLKEAIEISEGVLERKPNNLPTLQQIAQLHAEANRHDKAAEFYQRLIGIEPGRTEFWIMNAQHLRMLGRKEESQAAFRHALSLEPANGAAWWGLANYFAADVTDAEITAMEQALVDSSDRPEDSGPLHIALSILAERKGDHAAAFEHVSTGKAIQSYRYPNDPELISTAVDALIERFSPDEFARHAGAGVADDSPIFIIGMPRSGTTLLERILSRHSQIEAGGELPIMPRLHDRLRSQTPDYATRIAALSSDDITALGNAYVGPSQEYRMTDKPRFIDKLNTNWFHVGLLRLMLPNAKIIDLRRNALDCCWSNFKMLFADGHIASNDQYSIARYYRDYVRLVEAVSASAGGILHLRYEDLVDDVEGKTREIMEFLGLDFEADCLDFHLSTSAVATPSSEQVRRPINRDSIGSADPYREWLGPMIAELGDLAK